MNQELMNMVQQAVNSIPDHVDFEIPNAFAEAFAVLVAAAEREKVAKQWEQWHGFDKHTVAAFIRARGETK
jgi:hypothetical protein